MSYVLNEAKVGDIFRITDREGQAHHMFFAGKYKADGSRGWTHYNFLYWDKSYKSPNKNFIRIYQDISWQTSDFFTYKEDIIQTLASVKEMSFGFFRFPLIRKFGGVLSAEKPWLALTSYRIVIGYTPEEDIDELFEIIKLEEDLYVKSLSNPLLPKRKEQYTNESSTRRSEHR